MATLRKEVDPIYTIRAIYLILNPQFQALKWYKVLQRTKDQVFEGDIPTISAARSKIREEFYKNKDLKDENEIKIVSSMIL